MARLLPLKIPMKLAICFALALTPLMAANGKALYATQSYKGNQTKIIRKQHKGQNVRTGSYAGNPQGIRKGPQCGACRTSAVRGTAAH